MQADTRTIHEIMVGDHRYVVPPYQRPYVWERDRQWEPLWDDIVSTIDRLAEARSDAFQKDQENSAAADGTVAPHFMGAVVLEQLPTAAGDIDRRAIVDGQQRLTTIQLLLRGVLDALPAKDHAPTKKMRAQLRRLTRNDEDVVANDDSLHKVWPRRAEREDFVSAMAESAPPSTSSRFAAARAYFADRAAEWLTDPASARDPFASDERTGRVSLLTAVVRDLLKLVVIDLDDVDDAQVIFEVLNARNTPLTAADLVKNLLFMRAEAERPNTVEALYDEYWKPFDDDDWWSENVGTGHAQRPRMDRFLGDFLIAQTGRLVNLGHLYGAARDWILSGDRKVEDVLRALKRYAEAYRRLQLRERDGLSPAEQRAFEHIHVLRVVAADPLLLWLLTRSQDQLTADSRERTVRVVESYLIRRMATKWQTRAYGTVFADVLKQAKASAGDIEDSVSSSLAAGPSGYHPPSNDDVVTSFTTTRAYGPGGMNQSRLRLLLGAVDRHWRSSSMKTEDVDIDYSNLPVEHVMPQSWYQHWPLEEDNEDARAAARMLRDQAVQRIGNLTLLTTSLNSNVSNRGWHEKREAIAEHSILRLNARIVALDRWDEEEIESRGRKLAVAVCEIWPITSSAGSDAEVAPDTLDDDAVEVLVEYLEELARPVANGEAIFEGSILEAMEDLGIVTDPQSESRLAEDAIERMVGNGQARMSDEGLVLVAAATSMTAEPPPPRPALTVDPDARQPADGGDLAVLLAPFASDIDPAFVERLGVELQRQVSDPRYSHVDAAVRSVIRGDSGVLIDGGSARLSLHQVLRNLHTSGRDTETVAQALAVAAVASGGGTDGIKPAWQHCQDYGNETRGGHAPTHPVKGVGSPRGARALYNVAIGSAGGPGPAATAARGPADRDAR